VDNSDQGAQITGKPIKEAISKLWTVSVDQVITGTDQEKPIKEAISKLWTVPVVKCTDQGKPIKVAISRKTDQRSHFQTVDNSCRSNAQITGKPIKEAISKLWTVSVDQDQGAQITEKPIKEAISKLWTVPVDPVHRSKNPFPN
jgi:ribosomal protein L23